MLTMGGGGFRFIFALTLATGTFITVWVADHITQKGVGNGISVMIFFSFSTKLITNLFRMPDSQYLPHSLFEYFLIGALVVTTLTVSVVFMEKSYKKIGVKYADGTEAYIPLKITTAGTVPADWAGSIVILPFTVLGFANSESLQSLARVLSPGGIGYSVSNLIVIILLYYFFTATFYMPGKIVAYLKKRGALLIFPGGKAAEDHLDNMLEVMASIGAAYLCIFFFMPEIFIRHLGFPVFWGGVGFITTMAIGLDISGELRTRTKSGNLIKIAESHDIPEAGLCKTMLEQKGIPCHLQGYYHRALLYFFGPYVGISVLVPETLASDAEDIIKKYLDGNMLINISQANAIIN